MKGSISRKRRRTNHEPHASQFLPSTICRDLCGLVQDKLTVYDLKLVHAAMDAAYRPYLPELYASREFQISCARRGYLPLLKQIGPVYWTADIVTYAARSGHLCILQWIKDAGMPHMSGGHPCEGDECHACGRACGNAAENGHLHILQWANIHWPRLMQGIAYIYGYAAAGGQLDVLQWLFDNGYPCNSCLISNLAVEYKELPALKWLSLHNCPMSLGSQAILSKEGLQ